MRRKLSKRAVRPLLVVVRSAEQAQVDPQCNPRNRFHLTDKQARATYKLHCQNSMAPAVTNSRRYEHVEHVLASLRWLPVEYRVQFKIAVTAY